MRIRLVAALGSTALAATALAGAPAAEARAAAAEHFRVAVGNTWTDGTVTFYNRSVLVEGVHRSVSAANRMTCRNTLARTVNASGPMVSKVSSDIACGNTRKFSFVVRADRPGGATAVEVCLTDANSTELKCHVVLS
ncbi:hypothetical protein [Streptomyces sp. JHA26]|uniref:hypothetical protein n=1 Tax=Streptomyces sp. JHA26 TaxID=1917143 RepID=UPI00098A7353|nr:hypothetical protein [Streptomyces sp. JHA26]